jgi:branched-chain amino acid transport system substrate-binding protein
LQKLGVMPVLDQGYANQSPDFTRVVLAIKQSGATFSDPISRSRTIVAFWRANCDSSAAIVNTTALKLAGPVLNDTFGVADYAEDSSEASKAFGKIYRDAVKVAPDNQSAWPRKPVQSDDC